MGGGDNLIPLTKGSVLYLGSAVPLETSVGLEALQRPLRDRYLTGDPGQKVSAIDAVLTIFSGGILMQYPGDDSSSTWFPMQTLHMCAAVKAAGGTFVSVDSPQALGSREPPIFAVIARRSRGVKVLECHVFVCRSTEAALGFVQSCTHAFQHREGWMDGLPVASASARIVAAAADCSSAGSDLGSQARTQLQGFMYSPDQQVGMYNISGMEPPRPAPAPVQAPAPVPAPAPPSVQVIQQSPAVQVIQQPSAGGQPFQYITMNPPGAPVAQVPQISMVPQVPQISMVPQVPQVPMGPQVPQMPRGPQMMVPQGYFADWDQNYGMTMMVVPNSPFYPGDEAYNKENTKNKKKHKKHKKKNKRKSNKYEEEAEEDEEEEEEEFFYVRRSRFPQGQLPPDFVEVPSRTQSGPSNRYSTGQSEIRYVSEPMRPAPPPQHSTTEIHYVPIPNTTTSYREILPQENDFPPPDLNDGSTTDIFLAKVTPPAPKLAGAYYYFEDQGPPEFQLGGGGGGYDPHAYRVQPQDFDYDYGRDYDAARQQQQGQGGRQGVYDMRLPRTSLEVQYDERGFDGMADRLGYFP